MKEYQSLDDFHQLLLQLHLSYKKARKNKRNTQNQLAFEINQEANLHRLASAIYTRKYKPKPSVAFIIEKPVKREIFAADFEDRVVHHLIHRCLNPIVEKKLIHDTYSCRLKKGTLFGINRIDHFIRSCSENYQKEVFFLKIDVSAYFMSMQHTVIYDKVLGLLPKGKETFLGLPKELLLYLLKITVHNNVKENCKIKSNKRAWNDLPKTKSLFGVPNGVGLPIGNLTSQLFGNIYLNDFDHYVKKELKITYYGRYVDDMVFVHQDKAFLESLIPQLRNKLACVGLELHPNKIVLKSVNEGLPFLGQIIKPYRKYLASRTKNNFYRAITKVNEQMLEHEDVPDKEIQKIQATVNSYLGTLSKANTYRLRNAMMKKMHPQFNQRFMIKNDLQKVQIRKVKKTWRYSQNSLSTNLGMIY